MDFRPRFVAIAGNCAVRLKEYIGADRRARDRLALTGPVFAASEFA